MSAPSDRISALYSDLYSEGRERAWRDLGARAKAANIIELCRRADLVAQPRVVEIGCGEGAVAERLGELNFFGSYRGFEISPSGVAEAQARGVKNASFSLVEGAEIPAQNDSADLAILTHVVEHLEHPRQLLYEAGRIAPLVFVEVPLELHARLPRDYVWDDLGHINKYTSTSIRHLVQTCHMDVLHQMTTNTERAAATFTNNGLRTRLSWDLKDKALRLMPVVARTLFTYHESLLAVRSAAATG